MMGSHRCPGGVCEKHPDGVVIVAVDAFGERVVGRLREIVALPVPGEDPFLEIRVGERPAPSDSGHIQVLAGRDTPAFLDAICLSGDEEWLTRALAAVVALTTMPGIVCIDFGDLCGLFRGAGAVRGVTSQGRTATEAAAAALDSAGELLGDARGLLVHIEGTADTTLNETNEIYRVASDASEPEASAVYNFYLSGEEAARVTLLVV